MAIKTYKPTTSGRRGMSVVDYDVLSGHKPTKSLLVPLQKKGGRNNQGVVTVRHQGGGHKTKYRIVDFKRNKDKVPGKVASIEYDPNRNAFISLINYMDGEKRYILHCKDMKVGDEVMSGENVEINRGNAMPLKNIPEGTLVHNIELHPKGGGQLIRGAGTWAQVVGHEPDSKYVLIKLKSGEVRRVLKECRATIGVISNEDHNLVKVGKAGRKRWMGIRPTVRGSAMNPNDHPHGGGAGKAPIGRPGPLTPWGQKALGFKTRKKNKQSNRLIVKKRSTRKN